MSARLGLALGGAAIGGFLGGPVGARIGFTLGNFLGGQLFGDDREGPTIEGPRLNDLTISTSTYGQGIPVTYGAVRTNGNMIWATDIIEVPVETEIEQGGGKGSPSPPSGTQISYEYFGNFAMAFGEGPVDLVRKIWSNGKLLIDLSDNPNRGSLFRYGQSHYRIYLGGETQLPDPLIEADQGAGNVPGHRGMVYVVFENFPLKDSGNRIPTSVSAELVTDAPANFGQTSHNIATSGHDRDNTRLDLSAPFAVTVDGAGRTITKFNRLTATTFFQFDTGDSAELLADLTAQGFNINVANAGTGPPVTNPVNGDIVVGLEGTTGQGGGFSVWDKNGKFIEYRHIGTFSGIKEGLIFSAQSGESRVLAVASGLRANVLRTFTWTVDPLDPDDPRGVLSPQISSLTTADVGNIPTIFSFAVDPTKGAERAWALRSTVGSDTGPPGIIPISDAGVIGAEVVVSAITSDPVGIAYDTITDTIFVATDSAVYKLDPDTLAILDQIGDGVAASDGGVVGMAGFGFNTSLIANQNTIQGLFHLIMVKEPSDVSGTNFVRIDTTDLRILNRFNSDSLFTPNATWNSNGAFWDPIIPALWDTVGGFKKYLFDRYAANAIPLSTILTDLCGRVGLPLADLELSQITQTVRGYLIDSPTTVRGAIEPLQTAFHFDGAEINSKLAFILKNNASAASIPSVDLAARIEGDEDETKVKEPRKQEVEVPRRVIVSYMNQANDYMIATQMEQRIQQRPGEDLVGITRSNQEVNYRMPLVLSDQEAREIASVTLGRAWVERTGIEFRLPPKWLRLDPTDPVTVEKISQALTASLDVRLTQVEIGDGGVISCKAVLTDVAIYSPNVTATTSFVNPADPIPTAVGTEMFLMNLPNLRGLLDEEGGAWFLASPAYDVPNPDWEGALLSKGLAAGGPFSAEAVTLIRGNWGVAKTVLGVTDRFTVFDDTNTIDVEVITDTVPVTVTDLQLFAGVNRLYIPATGELLQYGTATQISDNLWRLSHLLRGRRGTEGSIALTSINETVVFVDVTRMARFQTVSDRGNLRFYIGTTIASEVSQTAVTPFTNTSESLLPLSPSHVEGTRNSAADLAITWRRRTRYNGELKDLVDVPLNETTEAYEVDIIETDADFASNVLLVPADVDADDIALGASAFIGSEAEVQGTTTKFGTGAMRFFPSTFSGLSLSFVRYTDNASYTFGSSDFAIEFYVRFSDLSESFMVMASHYDNSGNQRAWRIARSASTLDVFFSDDGTATAPAFSMSGSFTWVVDTWYHVAVTREGDDFRMFVDGTQVGSTTVSSIAIKNSTAALHLGKFLSTDNRPMVGFMDDVRITVGVARYTANFTAPTLAHLTSASQARVLRAFTGLTSPTVTYSATQQTADFGGARFSVQVKVYQLSEAVGRGKERSATLA